VKAPAKSRIPRGGRGGGDATGGLAHQLEPGQQLVQHQSLLVQPGPQRKGGAMISHRLAGALFKCPQRPQLVGGLSGEVERRELGLVRVPHDLLRHIGEEVHLPALFGRQQRLERREAACLIGGAAATEKPLVCSRIFPHDLNRLPVQRARIGCLGRGQQARGGHRQGNAQDRRRISH
jgi:hypothetical protein